MPLARAFGDPDLTPDNFSSFSKQENFGRHRGPGNRAIRADTAGQKAGNK